MPLLTTAGLGRGTGCPVCGGDCKSFPDTPHPSSYPFLPGGYEPLADVPTVVAPGRIEVDDVLVAAEGDAVPLEAAKRLYDQGRWPGPDPLPAKPKRAAKRAKKGPAEDRAVHGPREDRAKRGESDR